MRELAPLSTFPPDKRAEIERLAAAPTPPPKWLNLGMAQIVSRAWAEWYRRRGIDPDKRREKIPAATRAAIIARDKLICGLCGNAVEPADIHIDHILPLSLGGKTVPANLQVAHSSCNIKKGNRV